MLFPINNILLNILMPNLTVFADEMQTLIRFANFSGNAALQTKQIRVLATIKNTVLNVVFPIS